MLIQTLITMTNDMFLSDAHRLTLLNSMLDGQLRSEMSQLRTSSMAYGNAQQELHRKLVRKYIQCLKDLPLVRSDTIESFSMQLHEAVCTLESSGYGHELDCRWIKLIWKCSAGGHLERITWTNGFSLEKVRQPATNWHTDLKTPRWVIRRWSHE